MKKRIFRSICAVALASLLLLSACVVALIYRQTTNGGWQNLQADATYISAGIEANGTDYLSSISGYPGRITLIATDGTVLYDNRETPAAMDNHAARPEVAEALQNGVGRAQRRSDTLGERTLYYALRLQNGTVLRLSMQAASIWAEVAQFVPWLIGISLLLVAAAAFMANRQTRRIIAPINALNLDDPFDADAYEELAPLLRKIAAQKQQINTQMQELTRQQEEFASITKSMNEGLVVTDANGLVLTINQSACHILGVAKQPKEPVPLLELNRNLPLEETVKQAANGKRAEGMLDLNGRKYRLVASPSANGAVLLIMDDTEKLLAEQTRREFSANVSHELKTPLTSISGYAEIISEGLAKPEDVTGFAEKIHSEAARMISLVNDIIKLSNLDEKQVPTKAEPVDLWQLAQQTIQALEKPAAEKEVALQLGGEKVSVSGVQSILSEILYNLVENAIRYNNSGGKVEITLGEAGDETFIRVQDTGIGIAPEDQPHVFERFYRADKSHSRSSGGTGLGLSIVKRGALFHGGRVQVQSQPGKGSTFTVWLKNISS